MTDEFSSWKRHAITQIVMDELKNRILDLQEQMVAQAASTSQAQLAEKAGAIKAYRDVLDIQIEESNDRN